jgi:hypothetical protein
MKSRTARLAMVLALSFLFGSTFVAASQDPPATPAPPKVRKKVTRKSRVMRGVPAGVPKCLDHLTEMASTEPLTPYEGHPAEIINNGLLWNDAKSKCSIGSDQSVRLKVHELSKAWQEKNADRVKSLLGEIRSAAPAN